MLFPLTPITSLRMIGPTYALRLKKLGIETIEDLLYHVPFRYEDFSLFSKINQLQVGEKVTVSGQIISIGNMYTKQGRKMQKALLSDDTGKIEVVWYNQPFLINILKPGTIITIAGEVKYFGHKLIFESPDYEIIRPKTENRKQKTALIHTGRLVPIYPETAGISSKWLRSRIYSILSKFSPQINEFLPPSTLDYFNLVSEKEAIYKIHFPQNHSQAKIARRRLAFDELLILQLAAKIRRNRWQKEIVGNKFQISIYKAKIQEFINSLSFRLTSAQKRTVGEILTDLARNQPMNRLLEGDVGSGKTVVAAIAMYVTYLNGYQSALMAPTEILATQHYNTITKLLAPFNVEIALLTGNQKSRRQRILNKNFFRDFDILVGTHALLSENVIIPKLGLAVIDEQQRFGVEQRGILREKGNNPHILTMTATPIPRSIALTLYGDLDLSILDEMPYGRMNVKTWVVPPEKRSSAYEWIRKQITTFSTKQQACLPACAGKRRQAFIICPLIEESETLTTVKAVKVEFEQLQRQTFLDLKLGLLHGKLTSREKNRVFREFKKGNYDILVATPVVEVGIDIPQATIIMIEAAERFGLSQLHQLRGRVGRNSIQSYCLLFSESNNSATIDRLKLLTTIFNGPKLAELDLKLRGSGELFGTRQHGQINLKVADFSDLALIEETKKAADSLLTSSPTLSSFPLLRERLEKYTIRKVAPD